MPPHDRTRLQTAEIIAGEIIAWRTWLCSPNLRLRSLAAQFYWQPGVVAEGNPASGYGIHPFKKRDRMLDHAFLTDHAPNEDLVYGEVALWGDVIEHEEGYRASHAKIRSLGLVIIRNTYWGEAERSLREIYGVGAPSA